MEYAILYLATASLLAFLAAWGLGVRPGHVENRLLAAVLLLLAGSTAAFHAFRAAATPSDVARSMRVLLWYEIPALFLIVVFLDGAFLARPRSRGRVLGLAAAGIATAGLLAALVARPDFYTHDVSLSAQYALTGTGGQFSHVPGPLGVAHGVLYELVEAAAVVLCAVAAARADRGPLGRRQAAAIGIAFAMLIGHSGANAVAGLAWSRSVPAWREYSLVGGFLVVAFSARRIVGAFDGAGRVGAAVAIAAPLVAGAFDGSYAHLLDLGLSADPGYRSSRPLVLAAFAVAMAVGVARFGLAGFARDAHARAATATAFVIVLALGVAGGGVAVRAVGLTPAGLLAAAVVVLAPLALLATGFGGIAGRLADSVLLPPDDARVSDARIRAYARGIRETRDPDGSRRRREMRDALGLAARSPELDAALAGTAPEILLGRYVVERELGRGGNAVTLLAVDAVIGRRVVVKRLLAPRSGADHLVSEMRALARVRHPLVLTLYHAEVAGDEVVLVVEHAPGGSLDDRLAAAGPLSPPDALAVVADVLDALAAVHATGLVHADVKAANVLVGHDGRVRLADFGLARVVARAPGATAPLAPSSGTVTAMAPEQAVGGGLSPATDVYATGALLYRLLTGEDYVDFRGASPLEALDRVVTASPRLPHAAISPSIEAFLRRALAKDARERHRDATEARAALAAAASDGLKHEA